jgi:2-haloacid dehalogenase
MRNSPRRSPITGSWAHGQRAAPAGRILAFVAHPEAVVFDLGGVLIDWNPRHLYRRLFSGDEEAMEWFLANVTTPAWNEQQDRGRRWAEAIEELVALHPEHEQLIRAYHERWDEMLVGAHQDSVEVLAELHAAAVPLYALTNWSAETFDLARHRFPFLDWFRGIVVSGHERVAKPDEAIFRLMLERFGLTPGTTLFIDDAPRNVERARDLGMDAVHFSGADALRAELVSRGLLRSGQRAPRAAT